MAKKKSRSGKKSQAKKNVEPEVVPPEEARQEVRAALRHIISTSYDAPIPPAEQFAKYENVLPGAADRILRMAEKANDAEIGKTKYELRIRILSLGLGFAIIMTGMLGGLYLVFLGKEISGFASLFSSLGVLVSSLLYYKKKSDESK